MNVSFGGSHGMQANVRQLDYGCAWMKVVHLYHRTIWIEAEIIQKLQ